MARVVETKFIDDLDESEAAETVRFGLDGAQYEIDLSGPNGRKLREALEPFIVAGRRAAKQQPAKSPYGSHPRTPAKVDREQRQAIRTWWAANWQKAGLPEPTTTHGRIRQDVQDAYRALAGVSPTPPSTPDATQVDEAPPEVPAEPAKPKAAKPKKAEKEATAPAFSDGDGNGHKPRKKVPDEEFIAAYRQAGRAAAVAELFGMTRGAVYSRISGLRKSGVLKD